ncbi:MULTISPECIES: monovalent cation/H+ antiporter complex subunit F [Gammaproteobacteria]|uniref:pH regulation protein F n=3 Tax=Oceanospirillales TaxID=135619 RepID=A0A2A2EZM7_9GAMM|nr:MULTISPECIES: monovalent cation/H+ antiporter complex subunit F [Gammaproteobacteria]KAA8980312.1 pH regulation protein F [Halospina sp. K52047b]MYL25353.1 pH regulation protein F [Halomonas utahensis]MYL75174.1 pH regulation protein F [Halomonas sp. 22501_18_FS]PAU77829.1 pH regulation protein F [Halovibrio salipaludis]
MNSFVLTLVYSMLALAMLMAAIRLGKGPSLPDRVVAIELISSMVVGIIGVHALDTGVLSFLDVAIVVALVAFLASIGFARFIERGGPRE